jgi:hypothetical protein
VELVLAGHALSPLRIAVLAASGSPHR